jgi:hypothetical protein
VKLFLPLSFVHRSRVGQHVQDYALNGRQILNLPAAVLGLGLDGLCQLISRKGGKNPRKILRSITRHQADMPSAGLSACLPNCLSCLLGLSGEDMSDAPHSCSVQRTQSFFLFVPRTTECVCTSPYCVAYGLGTPESFFSYPTTPDKPLFHIGAGQVVTGSWFWWMFACLVEAHTALSPLLLISARPSVSDSTWRTTRACGARCCNHLD